VRSGVGLGVRLKRKGSMSTADAGQSASHRMKAKMSSCRGSLDGGK
jgi:hypothetical protein